MPDAFVGDPLRLRQVLVNLAGNAVKFTERGSVAVRLELESASAGEVRLHASVTDTGIGIPAERLEAIFEPFTQGDGSSTRKYGGTGLGTTIARRIAEKMRGRLWAESAVGTGSTFHFTVPLGLPGEARAESPPESAADEAQAPRDAPAARTVLVADSEDVSRTLIARMLERKGWSVRRVGDGQKALQLLESERFDVVLIDLRLPGVDGLETIRRIRARETDESDAVPIVVLVADAEASERMALAELGVQGLVPKPIDRQLLVRALERAWAARSARRLAA